MHIMFNALFLARIIVIELGATVDNNTCPTIITNIDAIILGRSLNARNARTTNANINIHNRDWIESA